jgi:hypothetical protein
MSQPERFGEYEFVNGGTLNRALDKIEELEAQLSASQQREAELQRVVADQILINPKEKIEIKFSDEAQAKAMVKIVKESRDLQQQNKELRERLDAFLDSLRDESLPDWAARKIYDFDKALSGGG